MKRLWFIVGVACRVFLVSFVLLVIGICFLLYYLSQPLEFVDLSGEKARSRMPARWPESIAPNDVEKVNARIDSQMDSYVGWYRIVTTAVIAAKWQDAMHSQLEDAAQFGRGFWMVEGVHRTVISPRLPPNSSMVGDDIRKPNWWKPATNEFRVTERMRWYDSLDSGYGDAVYSTFDPTTRTLWVYAQSRQHHRLWEPGSVPVGDQFVKRIEKAVTPIKKPQHEPVDEEANPLREDNPPPQSSPDLNR